MANGFANEAAKMLFSLGKFLANGRLRNKPLAIANATALNKASVPVSCQFLMVLKAVLPCPHGI